MSDANLMALRRSAPEATFGTPPGGTYLDMRYTGESLKAPSDTQVSPEIRDDRQKSGVFRAAQRAVGDVNVLYSYKGWDDQVEDALMADVLFAGNIVRTNTGTFSTSGSTITGTGVGTNIVVGDAVRLKNGAALLGFFKVTAASANSLTVYPTPPALTGSGDEEVERGEFIVNGVTLRTRTWEKAFTDVASGFLQLPGLGADTWRMEGQANGLWTGAFSYLGRSEDRKTATDSTAITAAATNEAMNGGAHVYDFILNQTAYALTRLGWTYNNKLRARYEMNPDLGGSGPGGLGRGGIDCGGPLELYLKASNIAELDKYHDFTTTPMALVLLSPESHAYWIEWPAVKLTDAQTLAAGEDQDVLMAFTWAAFRHATEDVTMRIIRWDA